MTHISYSLASLADVPVLARLRVEFLTELLGPQTEAASHILHENLVEYYSHAIPEKSFVCYLAWLGNNPVGIGGMAFRLNPGSFKNPTGRTGYIMNMYTIPDYRKQGICNKLLELLMDAGRAEGINAFELHASKDGGPIYIKQGFLRHTEPTFRKYEG